MATAALNSPSHDSLPAYSRSNVPAYSRIEPPRRETREHSYHLAKNGRQWLTLTFNSQAHGAGPTPRFDEGTPISGRVRLSLSGESVIRSVSVSVIGELTSPKYYSRFLTMTQQLFVSDANDLDISLANPPTLSGGKLNGEHAWSFQLRLPKGVSVLLLDDVQRKYRLPPALIDDASKAHISYKIVARVKKGILSSDHRLSAQFEYTPLLRPVQPSILRQIAALEGQPLVGPEGDPDGWKTVEPVTLRGKLFSNRPVEVTCALSISRPLCYTRGTPIPLMLSISSSDAQALDLLSSGSSPVVHLVRHASFSLHASNTTVGLVGPRDTFRKVVATGKWIPVQEAPGDRHRRRALQGEIIVPEDACPSCSIMYFHLQYTITMVDLKAPAFVLSAADSRRVMHSEVIQIVTVPAHGPQSSTYLPPVYVA